MPVAELLTLFAVVIGGFLLAGALAPFEALGWWAGWYGDEGRNDKSLQLENPAKPVSDKQHFVVFLSGINSVSGDSYTKREQAFLNCLATTLPEVELVTDIFPYSVMNRALTGQRLFARFWRWVSERKLSGPGMTGFLINVRNLWQVAVSADSRYGPIYNHGVAGTIMSGLGRHGYPLGSGLPITIIGYSGGAQIAAGAAPHLKRRVEAPLQVISLGGVLSADPGLWSLQALYHLFGERDSVQRIGAIFSPGRWRWLPFSRWQKAKQQGIVKLVPLLAADHTGNKGYLDAQSFLPGGRSYLEQTVDEITQIVRKSGIQGSGARDQGSGFSPIPDP